MYCTYYRIQYTIILPAVHYTDIHVVNICNIIGTFYIVQAAIINKNHIDTVQVLYVNYTVRTVLSTVIHLGYSVAL